MIEINWGQPVHLVLNDAGETERFCTIEKVRYWLKRKWPVADGARVDALRNVEDAMDCIRPVADARNAFINAARSAGYQPQAAA
ncbi:DUF982 domain-containing protein [Marivivens aquimaris]|uniref:DUF982 domain-containing protein n=1 Tax=Marivivens aquimaris TaxID=2774876 RepID=UPI00187E2A84|nr:DUF982 domain-containing protein [Marivivens aquimaris]